MRVSGLVGIRANGGARTKKLIRKYRFGSFFDLSIRMRNRMAILISYLPRFLFFKLLKKGLSLEKDKNFARRALYTLGETCVTNKIELEDGIKRLQKVIEMNGTDILAKQAQKILDSQKTA